jgi:hypothetical protein
LHPPRWTTRPWTAAHLRRLRPARICPLAFSALARAACPVSAWFRPFAATGSLWSFTATRFATLSTLATLAMLTMLTMLTMLAMLTMLSVFTTRGMPAMLTICMVLDMLPMLRVIAMFTMTMRPAFLGQRHDQQPWQAANARTQLRHRCWCQKGWRRQR